MAGERVAVPHDRGKADVAEQRVDEAVLVAEHVAEDEGHGDGGHDVGEQHAHAPEGLGADVLVEHGRDEDREDQLRHARQQEDAEGVAEGDPELRLGEHVDVLVEADEGAAVAHQVPVHEGDDRGVRDGEAPGDREEDEERGDVEVGRALEIPAAQPVPEGDAAGGALGAFGAVGPCLLGARGGRRRRFCRGHGRSFSGSGSVRGSWRAGTCPDPPRGASAQVSRSPRLRRPTGPTKPSCPACRPRHGSAPAASRRSPGSRTGP